MKLGNTLAVLSLVSIAAVAGAQGKHPMKGGGGMSVAEWQKMYNMAEGMFESKNAHAIFSYMAPDFTLTMGGKTMNRKDAEASLGQWFSTMKSFHCSMTVTKVTGDGMHAMVTDKFNNWGMTKPDPKTHKSGKMVDSGMETAHWEKIKGKWMMKSLSSSNEKVTMDGKPVKMGG